MTATPLTTDDAMQDGLAPAPHKYAESIESAAGIPVARTMRE
jgi:hypothetical protein